MSAAVPHMQRIQIALFLFLALNFLLWLASSRVYSKWDGVPPAPTVAAATAMSLGDPQFSYRALGIGLQNLGNVGRDITPLKNYDYGRLGDWFFLLHRLDPSSDYVPSIAAYYFGATRVPHDVGIVVRYLAAIGDVPAGQKWRWLAHAAYLSQHRLNDYDRALGYAHRLVALSQAGVEMPQWARQMPAFILSNRGDRDAARKMMKEMLVTDKNAVPEEVNFMKIFLIEQLGVPADEVESLVRLRGQ